MMPRPPINQLSSSPIRKAIFPTDLTQCFFPYGGSTAINVLDNFLGTPEIATQVENS